MTFQWITEPFQFSFMTRAFIGTSLIAILAAIVGVFIVLKGLAFIGDAIAHTSFTGLAAALLFGWPLHLGALVLAFGTAVGITILNRTAKVRHDTALAILFTGVFAVGILIMARMPNFAGDLSSLLLGSVLAVRMQELYLIAATALVVAGLVWLVFHHLVFAVFDPVGAEAAGLPVVGLHLLLMLMLSAAVVVSIQAVGVILVMALLITPAAAAGIFTKNIVKMMLAAGVLGLAAAWIGLYIAFYFSLPPGAVIVIITTGEFALALVMKRLIVKFSRMRHGDSLKEGFSSET
ncbi:MAG: metal ABC transporter permease [Candidatus Wallacebacter cryptica]|jgi:manganese/iron transport system permease protein|nr:metal ABC transporter permease [Bacillota bacterium]